MRIKIILKIGSLAFILALTGCISTSHFQSWSGQQEFEGQGGAFVSKDGIDIYSVGTPNKKCQILGVINTQTFSRADLMMLFGNSWSESAMVKEAKARGGDAIILADNKTQMWLSGGSDANGNSQIVTDASNNRVAILVKYVGDVQEQSVSPEIEAKLIGHWLFVPSPDMQIHGQWDMYFLPNKHFKSISSMVDSNGTTILKQPPKEEGRYYFTGNSIVMWADNETNHYLPDNFSVTDTQLKLIVENIPIPFVKQTQSIETTPIAKATAGQFKIANEKIREKAESGDADAQYQLGTLYYTGDFGATKDLTEAIKWYQKAADQNYPNMQFPLASAYAQRGALEQSKDDLDGALADYNKAIEIKPDFTEVYCVRGDVKQRKGDLEGAFADYNKVIEMNPRLALAYYARGLLNYDSQKFTDALADFQTSRGLGLDAQRQDYSHFYIWLIRAHLGEQDAATKELQTYLDNRKTGTPDDWPSKIANFLTGQLTEPDFFKAAENSNQQTDSGQHCEAYFYAGSKRLVEGDKTTATDYFKKCLATDVKGFTEYSSATAELKFMELSK